MTHRHLHVMGCSMEQLHLTGQRNLRSYLAGPLEELAWPYAHAVVMFLLRSYSGVEIGDDSLVGVVQHRRMCMLPSPDQLVRT